MTNELIFIIKQLHSYIKMSSPFLTTSSFTAIMLLVWDYLMYSQDLIFRYYTAITLHEGAPKSWYSYIFFTLICIAFISFPFFGLLADVWIGRYRAITIGIVASFLSWVTKGVGLILTDTGLHSESFLWTIYGITYGFQFCGYLAFKANIVQYNIDQLVGASADELNTIIYWHAAAVPLICCFTSAVICFVDSRSEYSDLATLSLSGIAITLVLASHSLFKHKLENISLIKNPIKLIVRVLCYARKHKYPENRTALSYWEEEAPSRLDLGKEKYGGPFTEEEVEDVKTFFHMLPLFISLVGFACSDDFDVFYSFTSSNVYTEPAHLLSCLVANDFSYYMCSFLLIMLYLFVARACFYKYIPSMPVRITVGLIFSLAVVISKFILFKVKGEQIDDTLYDSKLLLIPQIFLGISFFLVVPTSLEFTIAQTPVHMRGVMVGLWLASLGIGYLIKIGLAFPFQCQSQHICTSMYYHPIEITVVLLILMLYVILAKRYKYRVRENEVNIYQIVDDHYERYIKQEKDYEHMFPTAY